MTVPIISDNDLERLSASDAVRWIREAVLAEHAGRLVAIVLSFIRESLAFARAEPV